MTTKSDPPASSRDSLNNSAEASIRAALEMNEFVAELRHDEWWYMSRACHPNNITALLADLDAVRTKFGQASIDRIFAIDERDAALARAEAAEADARRLRKALETALPHIQANAAEDMWHVRSALAQSTTKEGK